MVSGRGILDFLLTEYTELVYEPIWAYGLLAG